MEHIPDPQLDTPDQSTSQQEIFKPHRKLPFLPILGVSITAIIAVGIVIGLMWQSNSFIAQNQDVRSDAFSGGAQTAQVMRSAQLAAKDQRFGVGGDCGILKSMGMPWMFNWGGGWSGKFNESELDCVKSSSGNMNTILTVGHADAWDKTNGISDSPTDKKYRLSALLEKET